MASSEFLDYFGFGYSNPISAQDISPSSLALCDDAIFEANYGDLFGSETFTRADDDVFGGQQGLSMFPSFPTLNMSLDLSLEGHNTAVAELAPSQSPPQNQVQYLAHEILGERETGNRDLDPNAYTGDPLFSTTLLPMPSQLSSSEHDEAAPSATDEMPNNEHPLYPIFVDDHGRPNQQFLAELELLSQQPQQQQESSPSLSSSRTGPSRTRARDNSAPYPQPAAVPHTHTKKAKARDDDNAWHVIVSPPSAIPP
ncbi:hypothetical protein EW145_g5557 [Phellinidium pouzarii]|uniref:Uncharacterized protein n=1 Tax=Phellinidium pouzarii TaxID=167371 RepID=A0A4S4KZQ8_9AGAM|nr:hypothetical protein EW145_g5557 [Phellinidium pouzarii]